jgi:transposase-like protein
VGDHDRGQSSPCAQELAPRLFSPLYKPEEIVVKLRQVEVLISQGQTMADAIRQIGVSEVTYYRWRQEFGGLKTGQVKRLKELELENSRLRKEVSDLTLDKLSSASASCGAFYGKGVPRTPPRAWVRAPVERGSENPRGNL